MQSYLVGVEGGDRSEHIFQHMLLFELYCDQPGTFLAMLQSLEELYSERLPTWLKSLSFDAMQSSSYPADGAIGDQDFRKIWGTVEKMKMSHPELFQREFEARMLFEQVSAEFQRNTRSDDVLRSW